MNLLVGDKFYPNSQSSDICIVAKIVRSAKTGRVAYVDDSGVRRLADAVEPYTAKLSPSAIKTLHCVVESILAGEESIEWLQALEPEHKAQLWVTLTPEQRSALKNVATGVAA